MIHMLRYVCSAEFWILLFFFVVLGWNEIHIISLPGITFLVMGERNPFIYRRVMDSKYYIQIIVKGITGNQLFATRTSYRVEFNSL